MVRRDGPKGSHIPWRRHNPKGSAFLHPPPPESFNLPDSCQPRRRLLAAVEEARHRVLSFIVGLLKEDKRNTALFGRSAHDAWTKTISVTMGPAAPWNDRVMTSRVLFNVVDSENASMEAVISLWRPGMGTPPTCALLHNCEVLKPSRRAVDLTAAEVLEKLVPSTEHLSIGIYGNDLCLVWSKAGVGASIS